ncbi:HpcH/HpaI aldolase/citrate lyase family protein [bacterium]|nr:HpcH/HpaI aldolase/citrate lyase family protein [bacterium]MBU1994890.1 HpcH/HpaI aldolase/citrate lyase family protein [bacterium]
MKTIDYTQLGATLFVPGTHKDLEAILSGKKYKNLKSVVIDTEDGIHQEQLPHAMEQITEILPRFEKSKLLVFIRPRNVEILKELLACGSIEKMDGFVLAKLSLSNVCEYFEALRDTQYCMMPSIEGEELFNPVKLFELRDILLQHKERIPLVRFGLEDMLRVLGMRRDCERSLFDICATSYVLGNFIATFKSAGFAVSGGVYPCFKDEKGFLKEVQRDLQEGLFSKTIIHPAQIDLTHEVYKVTQKELAHARQICKSKESVFAQDGKMAEVVTMLPHAKEILNRAENYGIKKS